MTAADCGNLCLVVPAAASNNTLIWERNDALDRVHTLTLHGNGSAHLDDRWGAVIADRLRRHGGNLRVLSLHTVGITCVDTFCRTLLCLRSLRRIVLQGVTVPDRDVALQALEQLAVRGRLRSLSLDGDWLAALDDDHTVSLDGLNDLHLDLREGAAAAPLRWLVRWRASGSTVRLHWRLDSPDNCVAGDLRCLCRGLLVGGGPGGGGSTHHQYLHLSFDEPSSTDEMQTLTDLGSLLSHLPADLAIRLDLSLHLPDPEQHPHVLQYSRRLAARIGHLQRGSSAPLQLRLHLLSWNRRVAVSLQLPTLSPLLLSVVRRMTLSPPLLRHRLVVDVRSLHPLSTGPELYWADLSRLAERVLPPSQQGPVHGLWTERRLSFLTNKPANERCW